MRARNFFVFVFALFLLVTPSVSRAQTSIAVVDVQALMTESEAAKNVQKQIETQREQFLSELSKLEQDLRKSEKDLADQQSTLPKEDFAKKKQEFETKFLEARRLAQKRKKALDDASTKAMGKLREEILKIVGVIAEQKGYSLVLSRQNVVIGDKSMDISEEAMKELNKAISKITLEVDAN